MEIRLTTLTENTAAGKSGLLAEHGLSMLVEVDGRRILFDTGQTGTAVHNARALGVDLGPLDAIVLSHGHADHTGGLKDVMREVWRHGHEVTVYGHPAIWSARYVRREGERVRFTGLPHRQEEMEALGARFRLAPGPQEVARGVTTTGEVPRTTAFERLDADLKVRDGRSWHQDPILDDQALLLRTPKGLAVVLGCAHSGIVNTLLHAKRLSGEERIYAVVGGTHLGFASAEQLEKTVGALKEFGIERLGVSHCSGLRAAARLAHEFGEAFFFNNAGTITEL